MPGAKHSMGIKWRRKDISRSVNCCHSWEPNETAFPTESRKMHCWNTKRGTATTMAIVDSENAMTKSTTTTVSIATTAMNKRPLVLRKVLLKVSNNTTVLRNTEETSMMTTRSTTNTAMHTSSTIISHDSATTPDPMGPMSRRGREGLQHHQKRTKRSEALLQYRK